MKAKATRCFIIGILFLIGLPVPPVNSETNKIGEYFEKSFHFETAGNYGASLNSVLRILQIAPKDYTATLRAGWLSYLKGDHEESIHYYKKAVSLAPEAVEPELGLMLPLMALKKWQDAEASARTILRSDPGNYLATSRLAYALFSQNRYQEAEKEYRELIGRYPSDLEMKLGLAWTYSRMGRKGQAAEYFREVLRVHRQNSSALAGMEAIAK